MEKTKDGFNTEQSICVPWRAQDIFVPCPNQGVAAAQGKISGDRQGHFLDVRIRVQQNKDHLAFWTQVIPGIWGCWRKKAPLGRHLITAAITIIATTVIKAFTQCVCLQDGGGAGKGTWLLLFLYEDCTGGKGMWGSGDDGLLLMKWRLCVSLPWGAWVNIGLHWIDDCRIFFRSRRRAGLAGIEEDLGRMPALEPEVETTRVGWGNNWARQEIVHRRVQYCCENRPELNRITANVDMLHAGRGQNHGGAQKESEHQGEPPPSSLANLTLPLFEASWNFRALGTLTPTPGLLTGSI